MKLSEVEAALDAHLSPADVEWKPFDTGKNSNSPWVQYAPYIDARAVRRMLDAAFTRWGWSSHYREVEGGFCCTITAEFYVDEGTDKGREIRITKTDGANRSSIEPVKGGISDSFKRAAVGFGIGASLYNYPRVSVKKVDKTGQPTDQLYKVLEWALPHLDRLVAAFEDGWRSNGDRVFLDPTRKPDWDSHQFKKDAPVVERIPEPEETKTATQPSDSQEKLEPKAEPQKAQKAMTKKQLAVYNKFEQRINQAILVDEFNSIMTDLTDDKDLDKERKNMLVVIMEKSARAWGVRRKQTSFYQNTPELDEQGQANIDDWLDAIANITVIDEALRLYDDFKDEDVLRDYLIQPMVKTLRAKSFEVDVKDNELQILAF